MNKKRQTTTDAVEILHDTFVKRKPRRFRALEKERKKLEIAEQIYELRAQARLSQKELADIVGTRQSVISRLEDADYGRHSLRMLHKIANAMHCKIEVRLVPENGNYAYA